MSRVFSSGQPDQFHPVRRVPPCVRRVFQANPGAAVRQPLGNFRFYDFRRVLRAANSLKILSLSGFVKRRKLPFPFSLAAPPSFPEEPYNVNRFQTRVNPSLQRFVCGVRRGRTV